MEELNIRELREIAEKATPGPWRRLHDEQPAESRSGFLSGVEVRFTSTCECGQVWSDAVGWPIAYCDTREFGEGPTAAARMANAAFIATFDPPTVLALLSSAEAREEAERNAQGWHRAVEAICTIAGVSCALGASEAVEAVRAALQSAEARAREAEGAWAWLTERPNLSLEHYSPIYGDDDDDAVEWRVHRESGNINDREWELVGAGPTALAAVQAARQALGASHG